MSIAKAEFANEILNRTAAEVGLDTVVDPWSSSKQHFVQMQYLLNTCGEELSLAHPWEWQMKQYRHIVQSYDDDGLDLPSDFLQMIDQTGWDLRANTPISGPLSAQEWNYLRGRDLVSQSIYASFRIATGKLYLFPNPPPIGLDVSFEYQSKDWVQNNDGATPVYKDKVSSGGELVIFDKTLMVKALKLKWLTAKGFDTTVALAEFQLAFDMLAGKDKGAPILNGGRFRRRSHEYLGCHSVPHTGFGY